MDGERRNDQQSQVDKDNWEAVFDVAMHTLVDSMKGLAEAVENTIRAAYAHAPANSTPSQMRVILQHAIRECMTMGQNQAVDNMVQQALLATNPSYQSASYNPNDLPLAWGIAPSVRRPLSADAIEHLTEGAQAQQGAQQPNQPPAGGAHSCPECDRRFNNRGCWYEHVRQYHIGLRCFWPGCGQTFADRDELYAHIREHYADAKAQGSANAGGRPYCRWGACQKAYAADARVLRHIMEHQVDARRAADSAVNARYGLNISRGGLIGHGNEAENDEGKGDGEGAEGEEEEEDEEVDMEE